MFNVRVLGLPGAAFDGATGVESDRRRSSRQPRTLGDGDGTGDGSAGG
jgi:hypothetical protein